MSTSNPVWLPRPQGEDREGDPVLTMTPEQKAMMIEVVYYGWCLTGYGTAPIAQALADRRHHPRSGDLVIIPDALNRRATSTDDDKTTQQMGIGYLVESRTEPSINQETWERYGESEWDGLCPQGEVHYVQYGPAAEDVVRWENAAVQAVPRGGEFAKEIESNASRYRSGATY